MWQGSMEEFITGLNTVMHGLVILQMFVILSVSFISAKKGTETPSHVIVIIYSNRSEEE